MADVDELFNGRVGNVYIVDFGETQPFDPNSGALDVAAVVLSADWLAGELGYIHEEDTPDFGFETNSNTITAWQANGNVLRTLMTSKVRSVTFTVRSFKRAVWDVLEPGTTYSAGANGTFAAHIPTNGGNPSKAVLIEIEDLDEGTKAFWYVPKATVASIGNMKAAAADTMNAVLTLNFEAVNSTDPLYHVVGNLPGLAP